MIQNKNTPLIILGIIAIFLVAGAVRPIFLSIRQDSQNIIIQKSALINLEKNNENIKNFQSAYSIYQANFKKLDQLFVDRETPVDFIEFLEQEANHSKLTIELTPSSLKADENDIWPSTIFQVDMTGHFQNFLEFLDRIESSPYLIVLSDFNLNKPTKNANNEIDVAFQMKVCTK